MRARCDAAASSLQDEPFISVLRYSITVSTRCAKLLTGGARRSRSGRRPGRVRWGRPLLSRPRGAFGSGAAAVEPAADSVVARSCVGVLAGMDGCEVRLCLPCARERPCVPCVSRHVPAPPGVFYGTGGVTVLRGVWEFLCSQK